MARMASKRWKVVHSLRSTGAPTASIIRVSPSRENDRPSISLNRDSRSVATTSTQTAIERLFGTIGATLQNRSLSQFDIAPVALRNRADESGSILLDLLPHGAFDVLPLTGHGVGGPGVAAGRHGCHVRRHQEKEAG